MSIPAPADPIGPSHVDGRLQFGLGLLGLVVGAAVLVQVWVSLLAFPGRVSGFRYDVAWFAAAAIGGLRPGSVLRSNRS
jgi:hypothetical protein